PPVRAQVLAGGGHRMVDPRLPGAAGRHGAEDRVPPAQARSTQVELPPPDPGGHEPDDPRGPRRLLRRAAPSRRPQVAVPGHLRQATGGSAHGSGCASKIASAAPQALDALGPGTVLRRIASTPRLYFASP